MSAIEQLCGMATWAAKNVDYNLDFVPADKVEWKAAPTAKSVLEIVNEPVGFMHSLMSYMDTGEWAWDAPQATTIEEARKALVETTAQHTDRIRGLSEEELARDVTMPFATMPMHFVIGMPVVDLIHHHGQIAYIQTLWGDTESHFADLS